MTPVASLVTALGQNAALILPAVLLAAMAAVPLVAAAAGLSPAKRTKIFRNKFGQQAATLALILLPLGLAAAAAAWYAPKPAGLPLAALAGDFYRFSWLPAGIAAVGAALLLVYRAAWQPLKDRKALHAAIGFAASLAFFAALALTAGGVQAARTAQLPAAARLGALDLIFFTPPLAVLELLLTAVAAALALCFLYLLARRKADDFGRDYYIYTVALCLRWAGLPALVLAGLETWRFLAGLALLGSAENLAPLLWLWPAAPVCALLAAAACFAVSRSLTPLRFKELACGAFVLLYLAISIAVTANAALLTLP
jgi:hypothetical protein